MVHRYRRAFFAGMLLVLVALALPQTAFSAPDGVTVTLSAATDSFPADQPVVVQVTITNPTRHTVNLLRWYTLADDLEGPLFTLQRDGLAVDYVGPLYKRPAPTHGDYVHLKSGESLTYSVDLSSFYDLSVTGSYRIIYAVAAPDLHGEKVAGQLLSNEISVWVEGRGSATPAPAELLKTGVTGTTSFSRCTTTQQSALISARSAASTYTANAFSYLQAGKQGSRYLTWFGLFDSLRYSTVKNHFSSIDTAMDSAPVTFDCGCNKKYYAYVYPNQPYVIYLCRVFWTAPMTGTDSKAGTLIHEMSHFNVVAGTNDWAYGQANAKQLAITSPDRAITNADNHEYFAENTPSLP